MSASESRRAHVDPVGPRSDRSQAMTPASVSIARRRRRVRGRVGRRRSACRCRTPRRGCRRCCRSGRYAAVPGERGRPAPSSDRRRARERDGWRAPPPGWAKRSATQVEDEDLLPAPFMRATAARKRWRVPNRQSPFGAASPRAAARSARSPARRVASRPRAALSSIGRRLPPRLRLRRRARRGAALSFTAAAGPGGRRPFDAAPAEVRVDPLDMMAALCCASSANAPSTLSTSVEGATGASGSRLAARGGHCS